MFSKKKNIITTEKVLIETDTDTNDPQYYNLTLNKSFTYNDNTGSNAVAEFEELNSKPILFNSGDWFIGLMRCSIPTCLIPKYIYPVQLNQPNINATYNYITFKYAISQTVNPDGSTITNYLNVSNNQVNVLFESELYNPISITNNNFIALPTPPIVSQDIRGSYYYIWDTQTIVKMFNDAINSIYSDFITNLNTASGKNFPADAIPFFTFDNNTQFWSFNAPSYYVDAGDVVVNMYNQSNNQFPRIEVFVDDVSINFTQLPNSINAPSLNLPTPDVKTAIILSIYNTYTNSFSYTSSLNKTYQYYKMTAWQSGNNNLSSIQKLIFEMTGDISLKNNEYDAPATRFQSQTNVSSLQKPYLSMLVDIEINRDSWSFNNNFIQFQASSIEQIRLLSLAQKSYIQNFKLQVSWIDNYGNKRPLEVPVNGAPLTVKLAFFNKHFKTK